LPTLFLKSPVTPVYEVGTLFLDRRDRLGLHLHAAVVKEESFSVVLQPVGGGRFSAGNVWRMHFSRLSPSRRHFSWLAEISKYETRFFCYFAVPFSQLVIFAPTNTNKTKYIFGDL
jgi:hypothetical protein